jgi:hypothetical protein
VYTHKQYSIQYSYSLRWGGGGAYGVLGLQVPILANFLMMTFCFAFCESCLSMVQKGGGTWVKGGGGDEWRLENKDSRRAGPAKCNKTPHKSLKTATGPKAVVQK